MTIMSAATQLAMTRAALKITNEETIDSATRHFRARVSIFRFIAADAATAATLLLIMPFHDIFR